MSSGPFTYALSAGAAFVLRSLMEYPDRQTADEIAGPELDAGGARDGLAELQQYGLAAEGADGRWHVTDAGRTAKQPA